MKTTRVLSLWKIKSNAKRRALIVVSFPVFFLGNLILSWAAWTAAVCLLWWANQGELFRSAAHYWHTDKRIEDVHN